MMPVKKTGKRVTASKALFFLVVVSSWTFLPGPGAPELASAASDSSSADIIDSCQAEAFACLADNTCRSCLENAGDDDASSSAEDVCVDGYVGDSPLDFCLVVGATLCCDDLLADASCAANAEVGAVYACIMAEVGCSSDDLPCVDISTSGETLTSGGVALVKGSPLLSTARSVVVAGTTLGLLVPMIATLL